MSDMYELLANASGAADSDMDYDLEDTEASINRNRYTKRRGHLPSSKSVFVPVAAYSITHNRPPGHGMAAMPSINRFRCKFSDVFFERKLSLDSMSLFISSLK